MHPRLAEVFAGVDHIVHAGDIGGHDVLAAIAAIAPVTAVAGNVDGFQCGDAGEEARVTLGGLRFYVTHILPYPSRPDRRVAEALLREPADVVVFGHSHLPHNERIGDLWFFNPASAGPRRFDYPVSVGIFERVHGRWVAHHVALDQRSVAALGTRMNQLSR